MVDQPGADTIDAVLSTPLAIEIHDVEGRPLDSTVVVFAGVGLYLGPESGYSSEVLVAAAGVSDPALFSGIVLDTTDLRGRASVQVRLGPRTPTGRLVVTVDGIEPALQDTVAFIISAGAPTATRMATRDTTVYVDGVLQLRGGVVDRRGNFRSEPVSYGAGPLLAVNDEGVVTPSDYARSWVVVRGAFGDDTCHVSVVPHGRVLGVMHYDGGGPFVLFDLDGSRFTRVPSLTAGFDAAPAWSPDGTRFVYSTFSLTQQSGGELLVADSTGSALPLFPAGTFRNAAYPRYSRDGEWIYFSAQLEDAVFTLWRVHPDGSGVEQLGDDLGETGLAWRPDPSPDGTQLAFTTTAAEAMGTTWAVHALLLSSTQASAWSLPGLTARWAPAGDRIAVMPDGDGPILVASADGTNSQEVTAGDALFGWQSYSQPFDWSPDGRWLVVNHEYMIKLLQVDTGLLLPLAWSSVVGQPTWQR